MKHRELTADEAFEKNAAEYRLAIRAADRMRLRALVGLGEKPTHEEMKAAEARIAAAFLALTQPPITKA